MKKRIYIIVLLFVFLLTSCTVSGGISTPSEKTYIVSFDSNGGTEVAEQIVEEGNLAVEPKDPTKENYEFICWTLNDEKFDFKTPISNDITLLAKWEQNGTHTHIYNEEVVEPTCDNLGYTIYTCECGESYKDNYLNNLDHDLVFFNKVEPTCTEIGCEAYVECTRCSYTTYKELEALDHNLINHEGKTPTDVEIGWKEYVTCTRCDYTTYEELPIIEVERAELEVYEENGYKYLNYGSYPQTHVNDETLITSLNNLIETNERGYYEFEGKEYAKVESVKPYQHGTYNDKYGNTQYYKYSSGANITPNTSEWFKVEPIKWRILSIKDGEYLVLSEYILTAQKYYKHTYYRQIDGVDIAPNNYKYSDIREFLNNAFFNSAFTTAQQNTIITKEVDNGASTTDSSTNEYVCGNPFDKVFILGNDDPYNDDYGFKDDYGSINVKLLEAKVTDYAKATGAHWEISSDYFDNGYWWLRSPDYYEYIDAYYSYSSCYVDSTGCSINRASVTYSYGVRPATTIAVN